jgi:RNA polymerase sigma-70 factor (ECF subfamily)
MSSDYPDAPEAELIERARRGEAAAFGDLYERHLDAIYRYVFYRVGDRAEAENLTQTVFLKAWEALAKYRTQAVAFSAWLYRIAHNTVIDYYRTKKDDAPLEHPRLLQGEAEGLEEQLAQKQSAEALARAIRQLDETDQQVLVLRFVSGLSHAETGKVLGRNEGYVRVLQHRALNALRARLKREEVGL